MATEQEKKVARASKSLTWHEFVAMAGGAVLALSLFLPWYHGDNNRATVGDSPVPRGGGDFTGFETHDLSRWLLIGAAAAPFILAYIVIRGHKLSWARGEMTAVTSIAAFGLIAYSGIIDKPGEPKGLISIKYGWVLAMIGVIAMLVGSALRASEVERARKPPGVL
ncbi:MAG TPA: hypothetical protein VGW10_03775 [Solirubrobacteraceae bacterium]|nr:hypothetical protein [Solirubrobacteraceae bacterium]